MILPQTLQILLSLQLGVRLVSANLEFGVPSRHHARDLNPLQKRETCGPGIGSCGTGLCCSQYNWCGVTSEHCGGGCQPQYGTCSGGGGDPDPGNGGGGGTLDIPRPQFGSIPYGVQISRCNTPGTVAITFDDGPHIYTNQLLDLLGRYGVKSTFFVNGLNFGDIRQYPDVIRRMVAEGHQVASHTFQHPDLDTLDTNGRRQQMASNEEVLRDILGFFPTYMRPPYGNCNGGCQADMAALGYHVIMWNVDTLDWQGDVQNSINIFDGTVASQSISLEHDVHQSTVQTLAEHFIQTTRNRGLRAVTVGECLGDPSGNWYRDPATGGRFTCSGSSFGRCCSQWGWCGSTGEYCGNGCQPGFGSCN